MPPREQMSYTQEQPHPVKQEVSNPARENEIGEDNVRYLVPKQNPVEVTKVGSPHLPANDPVFKTLPIRIYVQLTNEDIAKSATLLADYFTHNTEARESLLVTGIKAFGKDFDLTRTPEEYKAFHNRSFLTKVTDVFRKKEKTNEAGPYKDVQPEMIKAYSSFLSDFLEHHPEIIGEIEAKTGKVIGTAIGNSPERRRESKDGGIAV